MKGCESRKGWGREASAQSPGACVYLIPGITLSLKGVLACSLSYVSGLFCFGSFETVAYSVAQASPKLYSHPVLASWVLWLQV